MGCANTQNIRNLSSFRGTEETEQQKTEEAVIKIVCIQLHFQKTYALSFTFIIFCFPTMRTVGMRT